MIMKELGYNMGVEGTNIYITVSNKEDNNKVGLMWSALSDYVYSRHLLTVGTGWTAVIMQDINSRPFHLVIV
jgi:hypothetical protein